MADFAQRLAGRRRFLGQTAAATAGALLLPHAAKGEPDMSGPAQTAAPRWRGFNLLNFFQAFDKGERSDCTVREDDLRWMRDWGFDFVRLPMDYWLWVDSDWPQTRKLTPDNVFRVKEATLAKVDRTLDLCRRYGLHLSLNFHRAPGYCINERTKREPFSLWQDARAEEAFAFHWELFAKRYRDVPAQLLSFNLVNEAPRPRDGYMTRADYARVMGRAIEAIRKHTPGRIILVDGLSVGNEVVEELVPTGVAQSVHAYYPAQVSHYRASWVDRKSSFPTPTWPLQNPDGSVKVSRATLEARYAPWAALARRGIGVHCGECGCYNRTPYDVFIAWFADVLDILTGHGIGYALWNLRGGFGILDSGRQDIEYEDWHGHQLDRGLLELLQRH